jgi:hypothetical protein
MEAKLIRIKVTSLRSMYTAPPPPPPLLATADVPCASAAAAAAAAAVGPCATRRTSGCSVFSTSIAITRSVVPLKKL